MALIVQRNDLTIDTRGPPVDGHGALTAGCRPLVYASLGDEMRMAGAATNAAYSAAAWHVQNLDDQHSRFEVTVDAGPFTDLIGSAAAIAMLDLLNHAVTLFSWPAASTPVDDLLVEAQGINQTAAETMSGR